MDQWEHRGVTRGNYAWWDNLIGALMSGHADTGSSPGLPGTVRVEDQVHPSTKHSPQRWERADEWYNYSANVRGEAHVLATRTAGCRGNAAITPKIARRGSAHGSGPGKLRWVVEWTFPGFTASDVSAASTNTPPTSTKAWSASPAR
ncbi:ThuA domain-containing protein [Micromonospora sp. NPDC003944]